jgi:hypothetical protein
MSVILLLLLPTDDRLQAGEAERFWCDFAELPMARVQPE